MLAAEAELARQEEEKKIQAQKQLESVRPMMYSCTGSGIQPNLLLYNVTGFAPSMHKNLIQFYCTRR